MTSSDRHLGGLKKNYRPTPLNLEQLEARVLMTINTLESALDSLELVGAAKPAVKATKNAAPTVAKAISVAGGTTVEGTTANLTVLGKDDKAESLLTYTWAMASGPSGGKVTFSASGNNAAKSTKATFTKPGNYELRVTITDKDGATVKTTQKVTVKEAKPALTLLAGSSSVAAGSTITTDSTSVTLTSSLAATWSQVSSTTGGTGSISVSGTKATITFNRAGVYTFKAVNGSNNVSFSVDVKQRLATIALTPGTASLTTGSTQQFSAAGKDQFGASMNFTAAWTTTSGSITSNGLLTAPGSAGTLTVRAASGAVSGTATVTVTASSPSPSPIQDTNLSNLVKSLFSDGSLNRADVMQILRSAGSDGTVSGTELTDLRYIVTNAVSYAIPSYVQVLASNVVNSNAANATYQGVAAGNLSAGSSGTLITNLVDKWFMGTDLPTITGSGISYKAATGPLFVGGNPNFNDQKQGQLGDCYFISTIAAIAGRNPTAIANMFLDNGDGTFTVRFYTGTYSMFYRADGSISDGFSGEVGTADYVTVNRQLPAYSNNTFAYSNYGQSITSTTVPLWIALAEKAYAQWNQTGKANRNGTNTYAGIEGGWMGTVNAQVLGVNASSYVLSSSSSQTLINALSGGKSVTIGTKSGAADGLVGSHAYSIKSYDATTQTFALHNPWGFMHPGGLTWAQLQSNCTWFTVANATSSPIATTRTVSAAPGVRSEIPADYFAPMNVTASSAMAQEDEVEAVAASENQSEEAVAIESRAQATDVLFAAGQESEAPVSNLTPEAVDQLFDQLDSLLDEALLIQFS